MELRAFDQAASAFKTAMDLKAREWVWDMCDSLSEPINKSEANGNQ